MAAHTLSALHVSSATSLIIHKPSNYSSSLKPDNQFASIFGQKLSIPISNSNLSSSKRRSSTVATVSFSLPTSKENTAAPDGKLPNPEHPPLTEPAQKAIDWAIEEKLKSGESGEVTVAHLLLGIWSQKESAGHRILAAHGFDDEKAKEVAKNMDKDRIRSFKRLSNKFK